MNGAPASGSWNSTSLSSTVSAAAAHFGALAEAETVLDRLVLFHEPEAGAPFVRLGDFMLNGEAVDERVRAR